MSVAELENGLLSLASQIYCDDFIKKRREGFFNQRRQQMRGASIPQEIAA
jgi:hypothetical protein